MNAQQLKNSILQEAIEGRLVPQDPNDEPASVLLERIGAEKKRLVKEGKLKKKDLVETPISEDEIPFKIPESWEWCRVSEISNSFIGLTYKPADVSTNGWIVLRSSNIQEGQLDYKDIVKVNVDVSEKLRVRVNDIIICARNGSKKLVGKSALVREVHEPTTFGAFMAICRTQFYEYMAKYLLSPLFFQQLRKDSDTTTINQLTQKNFNRYLVPLPPLAEQKRIVAKIEELLPKVEEYGKAQESLDKLNEELPERLKKSILQEAFEGRLVPQDHNDEPASALLDKIRAEKKRLVKEGKLKKKDLVETPISEDEIPFKIPESWEWCKIENITIPIGNKTNQIQSKKILKEGKVPVVSQGQKIIDGYSNEIDKTINELPLVMFGDHTRNVKLIDFPFVIGADGTKFFKPILCNPTYIYYVVLHIASKLRNRGYARHYTLLRDEVFPLPPLAEQHRIVEKIEQLLHKIDKLKKYLCQILRLS